MGEYAEVVRDEERGILVWMDTLGIDQLFIPYPIILFEMDGDGIKRIGLYTLNRILIENMNILHHCFVQRLFNGEFHPSIDKNFNDSKYEMYCQCACGDILYFMLNLMCFSGISLRFQRMGGD